MAELAEHPTEGRIVAEAIAHHRERILAELAEATPGRVVTLGNAALRVFRALLDVPVWPLKLAANASYGTSFDVTVQDARMRWFPLAHPAAPAVYQEAHRSFAPPDQF